MFLLFMIHEDPQFLMATDSQPLHPVLVVGVSRCPANAKGICLSHQTTGSSKSNRHGFLGDSRHAFLDLIDEEKDE